VRAQAILDVLSGRRSVTAAAAALGVSRPTIYQWRAAFIDGGRDRLTGRVAATASERDAQLLERIAELTEALAVTEVDLLRCRSDGPPSYASLESIRANAGLSVTRFCEIIGISRRGYYSLRDRPAGPSRWPSPVLDRIEDAVAEIATASPRWGYRRVWRQLREDGDETVSPSSVKRAMQRRGLLTTTPPRTVRPDRSSRSRL
jgi:transposase-like protein